MALKILYPVCCGIDVHKTFVVACIASTNSKGVTTYKHHRFSTFTKGLNELSQWLCEHDCKDVCMESTGKYWIPRSTFWSTPATSRWHTQNTSRPFEARR
ncbi:transposase, partial [Paenibacillaceae bacterium T2]|nr:transposase [Paenibacillaceae bacterium T2]